MSTFMANKANIERKWYILDAAGKPLGKTAVAAADLLRGKHKPTFTPHVDTGDYVIVVNADKMVLTGKKLDKKMYRHHTGYPGGLKEVSYRKMMAKKSDFLLKEAVRGMLPKNPLGYKMLKKLHVYAGAEHAHQAQKPVAYQVKL